MPDFSSSCGKKQPLKPWLFWILWQWSHTVLHLEVAIMMRTLQAQQHIDADHPFFFVSLNPTCPDVYFRSLQQASWPDGSDGSDYHGYNHFYHGSSHSTEDRARGSSANALIDDLICILDFYCFLASQGHPKNFLFFCAPDRRWAESQGLPMMTDLLQVMMDPVSTRATMMDLCRAMTVPI